jgi:hypothetical protein
MRGNRVGLFDIFKSKPNRPPDVLESLLAAAERKDFQALAALCETHQGLIHESFAAWSKVPEPVRTDPAALKRYAEGLIAVAQMFEQGGDARLFTRLMGEPGKNPIDQWQSDLESAQKLLDCGKASEAIVALETILSKNAELQGGTGLDFYLPRTFGLLGLAYSQNGERSNAIGCMEKAKALCEQCGDLEGVAIYEGNLRHLAEQV